MTSEGRRSAKWALTVVCVVWMAWAAWAQFHQLPDSAVQTFQSPAVKERMRDCDGTFQKRYECKEAIVINTHRETFYELAERLAVVVLPPILAGIAFALLVPKPSIAHHAPEEEPDAWKKRAHSRMSHHPHDQV